MTDDDLIEEAASAHRERRPDGHIADSPAWHDLDDEARTRLAHRAAALRQLEASTDPDGLSTAARAVLKMIMSSS